MESEYVGACVREQERAHALGMTPAHGGPAVEFEMFDMPLEVGPVGGESGEAANLVGHGQSSTLFGPRPLSDGGTDPHPAPGTTDWRQQAVDRYLGSS